MVRALNHALSSGKQAGDVQNNVFLPVKPVSLGTYKSIVDIKYTKLYVKVSTSISQSLMLWLLSHNRHEACMSIFTLIS